VAVILCDPVMPYLSASVTVMRLPHYQVPATSTVSDLPSNGVKVTRYYKYVKCVDR